MSTHERPSDKSTDGPMEPSREFLPANWNELAPLIDLLLDTPPHERARVLAEISGGSAERRRILEQLLLECERDAPLLDASAAERFGVLIEDAPASLPEVIGDRYRVGREIGRGGMARVYLAQDIKHARDVAIKVIRPELAASLGRNQFLREVGIAARLRHPNIVPVYDSGDVDGALYFVMPYEEGQSLRQWLQSGPLNIADAVSVMRDVARALAYAHAHGVVHRDIKPDNVMMSGGAAVVADFGIARAVSSSMHEIPSPSPSLTGAIGTPAYMAPEQGAADPATDHRADIYAFGCMAYEMLVGRAPFHGLSTDDLIVAHRTSVPVPTITLRPEVDAELSALIVRCLEKQPALRPQSASELLAALDGGDNVSSLSRLRSKSKIVAIACGTIATFVVAGLVWNTRDVSESLTIGNSAPLTADEGLQVEAAISPNGQLVAFAKGDPNHLRIYVERIADRTTQPLTDDSTSVELLPRWAPDNNQIAYLARNNAYVARVNGGVPTLIASGTPGSGMVRSASWSPLGDSIAISRNDSLLVVPAHGSGSRLVGVGHQLHDCAWSPNNAWLACVSGNWLALEAGPLFGNDLPSAIQIFPVAGGKSIELIGTQYQNESPTWSADGKYLWLLSNRDGVQGEVYSVRIGRDGRATGAFVRVGLTAESISLSQQRLAYSVQAQRANIWSVPVGGIVPPTIADATRITTGTQLIEIVNASIDGKWIVYDSNIHGNAHIYRVATAGGKPERLTNDEAPDFAASLSPNSEELAWHRVVGGVRRVFVKALANDSLQSVFAASGDYLGPMWSPDGRALAVWSRDADEGAVSVVRRDSTGRWQPPSWRLQGGQLPVWSMDGRTVAFIRYDGGIQTIPIDSGEVHNVYVRGADERAPIARHLIWNLDPSTIWFIGADQRGRGGIWSVPAIGGAARLRINLEDPNGRSVGPSVTTDGKRFYFTLDERISNVRWAQLVKR